MQHEQLQQRILLGGKPDVAFAARRCVVHGIQGQIAQPDHGRPELPGPPLQRPHAGQEHAKVEGLGQIIVRPAVEAAD
jgi:hypothetical protein